MAMTGSPAPAGRPLALGLASVRRRRWPTPRSSGSSSPEANPDNVAVWRRIADDYQAAHPGVTIEMQFLENQVFKAKLPTSCNRARRRASSIPGRRRAAGAGRDRRAARRDRGGGRATKDSPPVLKSVVDGMTFDGKVWRAWCVRLLLQQGFVRQGRGCIGQRDQDLGRLHRRGEDAQGRGHHADRRRRWRQVADPFLLGLSWPCARPARTALPPPRPARATVSPASPSSRRAASGHLGKSSRSRAAAGRHLGRARAGDLW